MTSKSSGKEPPSVGSVITCPPVQFDRSSSVSVNPSVYFDAPCIPPSAQSYRACMRQPPLDAFKRHLQGAAGARRSRAKDRLVGVGEVMYISAPEPGTQYMRIEA